MSTTDYTLHAIAERTCRFSTVISEKSKNSFLKEEFFNFVLVCTLFVLLRYYMHLSLLVCVVFVFHIVLKLFVGMFQLFSRPLLVSCVYCSCFIVGYVVVLVVRLFVLVLFVFISLLCGFYICIFLLLFFSLF